MGHPSPDQPACTGAVRREQLERGGATQDDEIDIGKRPAWRLGEYERRLHGLEKQHLDRPRCEPVSSNGALIRRKNLMRRILAWPTQGAHPHLELATVPDLSRSFPPLTFVATT